MVHVQTDKSKVQHRKYTIFVLFLATTLAFTIVMEMDEDEEGGNIQMFNFQYFGFYPGYVTLHSKEGYDGAVIIGTNFSKHSLPKVTTLKSHAKR